MCFDSVELALLSFATKIVTLMRHPTDARFTPTYESEWADSCQAATIWHALGSASLKTTKTMCFPSDDPQCSASQASCCRITSGQTLKRLFSVGEHHVSDRW